MKAKKAASVRVVGLARNVEQTLKFEVTRLNAILSELFDEVTFFVVESDSVDKTRDILEEIAFQSNHFHFTSLGKVENVIPNRVARLAYCRNVYVDWLRKENKDTTIMVIDFDIQNSKLSSSAIAKAIGDLPGAAAIFANQSGRYFDIYALRCPGWSESDCNAEYWKLRSIYPPEKAKQLAIWSKMRKIPQRSRPISVDSAFGGLGIYKHWVFRKFDYSPSQDEPDASEHVSLHLKIRTQGGEIYIHPGLVNFAWNPHNLSSFRILRTLDRLSATNFRSLRRRLKNRLR